MAILWAQADPGGGRSRRVCGSLLLVLRSLRYVATQKLAETWIRQRARGNEPLRVVPTLPARSGSDRFCRVAPETRAEARISPRPWIKAQPSAIYHLTTFSLPIKPIACCRASAAVFYTSPDPRDGGRVASHFWKQRAPKRVGGRKGPVFSTFSRFPACKSVPARRILHGRNQRTEGRKFRSFFGIRTL